MLAKSNQSWRQEAKLQRLRNRSYLWSLPLCTSRRFHCMGRDWLLVSINQLQFSIVRRTTLSYDLLYFCLLAGHFTEVCVVVILHLLPHHQERVVFFGGVWVPLNLAGCVEVVWTTPEGFCLRHCRWMISVWCYSSAHCLQHRCIGFKRRWI